MDTERTIRLYHLWHDIYPWLTSQIVGEFRTDSGKALELGAFAGGIAFDMVQRYPGIEMSVATGEKEMSEYLAGHQVTLGVGNRVRILKEESMYSALTEQTFDLIVFRGAFFFIMKDTQLLPQIWRALNPGGMAFVGGGYGKDAPTYLIDAIHDESHRLNDELGRVRVTVDDLGKLIEDAGLTAQCRIVEEGGLWILMRKGEDA